MLTLRDNADITSDGPVIGGNKIKVGLRVDIEGFKYRLPAVVSDVRILEKLKVMDIFQSSLLIKCINKIDLSNRQNIENLVQNSFLARTLNLPLNFIHNKIKAISQNSILCKYIDHLILFNLLGTAYYYYILCLLLLWGYL